MNRLFAIAAVAASCLIGSPAFAALTVGSKAPQFTASGFLGGKPLTLDLNAALKKGPVVLYFFPGPYTEGCDIEAHLFAESIDKFHALGATVIGVTSSNLNVLAKFTHEPDYCASKFPVAADPKAKIADDYDAKANIPIPLSTRVTYVISPKGQIISVYDNIIPKGHIDQTLAALKAWRSKHPA